MRRAPAPLAASALLALTSCDRALDLREPKYDPDLLCDGGACVCRAPKADCNGSLADGCEVDLRSDPDNCGACFHSCFGGECNKGVCGLVRIATLPSDSDLQDPVGDSGAIAAANGYLYVSYRQDSFWNGNWQLVRFPVAGSLEPWSFEKMGESYLPIVAPFILDRAGTADPRGLYAFVAGTSGASVVHLGFGAGAGERIVTSLGNDEGSGLALAGTCLYVGNRDLMSGELHLDYVDPGAAAPQPPAPVPEVPGVLWVYDSGTAMTSDGQTAYFATLAPDNASTILYQAGSTCGTATPLHEFSGSPQVQAMTMDPVDGTLYFTIGAAAFEVWARRPGAKVTRIGEIPFVVTSLAAEGGEVYWLSVGDRKIGRMRWTGDGVAESETLVEERSVAIPQLAIDHDRVYWSEGSELYAVARPHPD